MGRNRAPHRRHTVAAVMAFVALVGGLSGIVITGGTTVAVASIEQMATVCAGDKDCLAENFVARMSVQGIEASLPAIPALAETSGVSCHVLSHIIGELAYLEFNKSVFDVYAEGCDSGFTHGWMLSYARAVADSADAEVGAYDALRRYCDAAPDRNPCVHGVGHALATRPTPSADVSRICRAVAPDNPRSTGIRTGVATCVEGYAMEFQFDRDLNATDRSPDDVASALCDPVDEELRPWCTTMVYRRWVELDGVYRAGPMAVFQTRCAVSSGKAQEVCYMQLAESVNLLLGREQLPVARQAEAANSLCADAPSICVNSQIAMITSNTENPAPRLAAYCAALREELQGYCRGAVPRAVGGGK